MKIIMILFGMSIFLSQCKNETNQSKLDKNCEEDLLTMKAKNDSLSDDLYDIEKYFTEIYGLNLDLRNQQIIDIQNRTQQHKRYQAFGTIKNNILDINIPVSDKALKIETCVNISNNKFNVLVIGLNKKNNDGSETDCEAKYLIKRKFDISKLRYNSNLKKLCIITINTNNFNYKHIIKYSNTVFKCSNYQEINDSINASGCDPDKNNLRPDEDGGSTIP